MSTSHNLTSRAGRLRSLGWECLERRDLLAAVSIVASLDNSLFEDATKSNGKGDFLFSGRTKEPEGRSLRRAMVAFDLTDKIPVGATIDSVSLSLFMSKAISNDVPVALHRVTESWGEGTSNSRQRGGGTGADATPGDSTWLHRQFPGAPWTTTGGTFAEASAITDVGIAQQQYVWASDQMVIDVETWIQNSDENFGWILIGDEQTDGTAKRFNSRENPDAATRPTLTIEFTEAPRLPTLTVSDASVLEGSEDSTLEFTVTLSEAPAEIITFNSVTIDGSAVAGQDYVAVAETITFGPNDPLTKTILVPVIGDNVTEGDESLTLQLSDIVGAEVVDAEAVGTILNDDSIPTLSVQDISVEEGNDQNPLVQVPVELSNPSAFEITVDYRAVANTAQENDFILTPATLTFAPGETEKTIDLSIVADVMEEADEVFSVELSNPSNAIIADGESVITILNDDVTDRPWQNKDLIWDVTGDGHIVPRDVLVIINYINANGSGPLPSPNSEMPPPFYDVSGDNQISPRDALVVINFINDNSQFEGEPVDPGPAATDIVLALALLEED